MPSKLEAQINSRPHSGISRFYNSTMMVRVGPFVSWVRDESRMAEQDSIFSSRCGAISGRKFRSPIPTSFVGDPKSGASREYQLTCKMDRLSRASQNGCPPCAFRGAHSEIISEGNPICPERNPSYGGVTRPPSEPSSPHSGGPSPCGGSSSSPGPASSRAR